MVPLLMRECDPEGSALIVGRVLRGHRILETQRLSPGTRANDKRTDRAITLVSGVQVSFALVSSDGGRDTNFITGHYRRSGIFGAVRRQELEGIC